MMKMEQLASIIEQIHASGHRVVMAITGGGSAAIAALLRVPGGSNTLLEASVPYSFRALTDFCGVEPPQACSRETAVQMAQRALARARRLNHDGAADIAFTTHIGLGVTSSLASSRPKRGAHRSHIAVALPHEIRSISIELDKGARDRAAEEDVVAAAIVLALAQACGIPAPDMHSLLSYRDHLTVQSVANSDLLTQLLTGSVPRLTVWPDGCRSLDAPTPVALLPGSFNPAHAGHYELAQVASRLVNGPIAFEISVVNVDKPPLDRLDVEMRLKQFAWHAVTELTRAATFREKSRLLPGTVFVIGADTAARIVDSKYYESSDDRMFEALEEIAASRCRFLVAGRHYDGSFHELSDLRIPTRVRNLFEAIPQSDFRRDISSTDLRQANS